MGKQYVVESEFEDLHAEPGDKPDLEVDLSDSDNPIIRAALDGEDDNWSPPEKDEKEEAEEEEDEGEDDEDEPESDEDDDEAEDEDDGEEESDDDDDEAEDEDEDDDKSYSKKVKARIDRERKLRMEETERARRRIAKLERRIELREAKDEFNKTKSEAEAKLRKLKKQKAEALDEGETTKVVDIDDEILDIKAELKIAQVKLKEQEEVDDGSDDPDMGGTPDAGRKWLEKYPQFHSNSQFRNVVLAADRMVAARGFDKNTEGYYLEMEEILRPQFPSIISKKKVKVTTKKPAKKRKSAVGGTSRAGTRKTSSRSSRGRVRLTKVDQDQMVIFGLDPKNPADVKAWAENKAG